MVFGRKSKKGRSSSGGGKAAGAVAATRGCTFGVEMKDHMAWARSKGYKDNVPPIIKQTVQFLSRESCIKLPGLFRKAGDFAEAKVIRKAYETNGMVNLDSIRDEHTMAKTLKDYLRELPTPLIPYELYPVCIDMQRTVNDPDAKRDAVRELMQSLDPLARTTLKYLLSFFRKVSQHSDDNLMTPSNIALVIGPNILRTTDLGTEVRNTGFVAQFVTELITLKFCPSSTKYSAASASAPSPSYSSDHATAGVDYLDDESDDDDDFDLDALVSNTARMSGSQVAMPCRHSENGAVW
ncbi:uncharacterized protein AMSG_04687 [Thecamonas trahens ATCC 50062]|uniref:Rho-GAP domain-containing protein n=1 Tax=Thecamonas trahens ATCC 50062 TaxID=461836 RepID=A0A0L0D982_THETB|nr:hypothetical protein AMSG_04687 [Thecamonas trahens ATCC 50062]KNC48942.1 hypothetical protein AMSG_04687 [Thecamonas trahens ATCC 50062]|eukprot:XP_013758359.1 hypothetical protein AMSG_04687 [Thecamonas trahens ATCC 50062]